jgi:phospholipid-binding lipoprotein MlaA
MRTLSRCRGGLAAALALSLSSILAAPPCARAGDLEDGGAEDVVWDPWEPLNRKIFGFNEFLDTKAIEPLAKAWAFVVPKPVRTRVRNVFDNTLVPGIMLNTLLQGKPVAAAETLGRFLVNTTLGIGGLFDVATHGGVKRHDEDFGQTFGTWGIPPGPYLVLPLLGPSNPRDTVGGVGDRMATVWGFFAPFWVGFALAPPELFNARSLLIDEIAAERAAAFDWYVAQRDAYMQYRANLVRDRKAPEEAEHGLDLYYFEDDEEAQP